MSLTDSYLSSILIGKSVGDVIRVQGRRSVGNSQLRIRNCVLEIEKFLLLDRLSLIRRGSATGDRREFSEADECSSSIRIRIILCLLYKSLSRLVEVVLADHQHPAVIAVFSNELGDSTAELDRNVDKFFSNKIAFDELWKFWNEQVSGEILLILRR